MVVAKALAKAARSSLALMMLLANNGETTSATDAVGSTGAEECLVVQGLPLQVQLNNGVSGEVRGS